MWNLALPPLKRLCPHYDNACGHQTWWLTMRRSQFFDHVAHRDQVTNRKYIFTVKVPVVTTLSRVVTYPDELLPVKSYNRLAAWSCKITSLTKTIISPIPQCLWLPNLKGWWLTLRGSYPCYSTFSLRRLPRSCDNIKPFHPHFHNAYGHQIWQECALSWEGPNH